MHIVSATASCAVSREVHIAKSVFSFHQYGPASDQKRAFVGGSAAANANTRANGMSDCLIMHNVIGTTELVSTDWSPKKRKVMRLRLQAPYPEPPGTTISYCCLCLPLPEGGGTDNRRNLE